MKIQFETIEGNGNSSYRIMVNPNLSDLFFWHFHPELELVYIEGADGSRHVGDHISSYTSKDLVFIGSDIPHLNFDYGVKTDYSHIVLHLKPDFLKTSINETPELKDIEELFKLSQFAVSFGEEVKREVGTKMKALHLKKGFQQFLEVLDILQLLAADEQKTPLHQQPVNIQHRRRDQKRLAKIYKYVEEHYHQKISLEEIAEMSYFTKEAFCRYFKKMTKLTFTQFVNHYRIEAAKKLLLQGKDITDTCYSCGFESISYFNRVFKKVTGTNPMSFKRQYVSALR